MSSPEPAVATRSRENTLERLRAAASEVFAESGFDGASVEAICERAGFTRGAFYSNFSSKDELFISLASQFAEQQLDQVVRRMREIDRDPVQSRSPAEIVEYLLDSETNAPGVVLVSEIRTNAMRDDRLAAAYLDWQEALIARVAEVLESIPAAYGLRLRLPAADAARLFVQSVESDSVHAVIARLDPDAAHRLVTEHIVTLAGLVVDADKQ